MNLPEDHMDELFRKAGEMYPLKTDGADWDKVMSRLQEVKSDNESALAPAGARTSRRWWWLMLLIVPFAWICTRYTTHTTTSTPPSKATAVASKPAQPATSTASTPSAAPAQTVATPSATTPSATPQPAIPRRPHAFGMDDVVANGRAGRRTAENDRAGGNASAFDNGSAQPQPPTDVVAFDAASLALTPGGPDVAATHGNTDIDKNPDDLARPAHQEAKKTVKYTPTNGLYAGIVAGPDLSNVKWQQITNPGYTAGVVLGYRFNRRLSAETGLYWAHKAYYTDGEYFDKKKADIPAGWNVNSMNGTCGMFEIPVNLRWDFAYLKNGSFYAVAGLSSYMMKKEAYKYEASSGSSYWPENASYTNSGNNFLSIMNLSVGYSLHWGKVGDVRIEPYFKIPLKGVGIGSLPITSTGLYLGITHSFR